MFCSPTFWARRLYNELMHTTPLAVYRKLYDQLNAEQKKAVDTIEGPVMVVAGPGTGKTQILTLRIANILLKTQINASNILALTFTQAAATNMRERLHAIIGHEAHHVQIFTFHAFCSHLIEEHPDDFWDMLGMQLISDVEKAKIIESVIDAHPFAHIKPFKKPHHYVSDAMRAISDLKREGVSPEEFKTMIDSAQVAFDATPDKESTRSPGVLKLAFKSMQSHIQKNTDLQMLYEEYEKTLAETDRFDYDGLIMAVLSKLRDDADFRLRIMEQYQYILVDEHQDSNNSQNKIITYLTSFHDNPNIFVVGDEKQAIFRFQGASVENFRSFKKTYPGATIITLVENYRSHQTILDSAISILGTDDQHLHAEKRTDVHPIQIIAIANPLDEIVVLTKNIKAALDRGVNPHEIAVLTRNRSHAKSVLQALMDASIPAYADLAEDVLEEPITEKLLILLRAIHEYADDEALFRAFHLDVFGLPPYELYKLSQAASKKRKSLAELLASVSLMEEIGITQAARFHDLFTQLGHFYVLSHNESLNGVLHTIVRDSGFLRYMLKSKNPILVTAPIRALFDQVQTLDKDHLWKLSHFFEYLEKLKEHGIRLKVGIKLEQKNKVQILTTHSAKGLEYEVVCIPFATDAVWGTKSIRSLFKLPAEVYGSSSGREDSDDEADERRLFFVAVTRAKSRVIISYATQNHDGKATIISRFASSIKPELVTHESVSASGETQALVIRTEPDEKQAFLEFVQSSFASYGLSVSALNNYLQCPWKYFYVNLVRVPSGKETPLMFGNAIHNALSLFYIHYKDSGDKSLDYLLEAFEKSALQQEFTTSELGDVLVHGKVILTAYFKRYEDDMSRMVRVKYRIPDARLLLTPGTDDCVKAVKLTGEIDIVNYLDTSMTQVEVIDFKTGRAKSRNEIMGKTQDADGNYYRQIVFYKLLLSLVQPKWRMKLGTLDFVEADKNEKFHRESFEVLDEEVEALKNTIALASEDIQRLGFWEKTCGEQDCTWCAMRQSLAEKQFENGLF